MYDWTAASRIGTAPMDALMAYAGAHEKCDKNKKAFKSLEAISLSGDDGVESHTQPSDLMYNWNFGRFDSGDQYYAAAGRDKAAGEKSVLLNGKQRDLVELNRYCRLRDA
ncbi:hypothetical protein NCS52_00777600 [Fusarium sp. LHS14.1]|nr:hypothetical protein NCS52_00777600 [Fusarium sp. LHS14.1]